MEKNCYNGLDQLHIHRKMEGIPEEVLNELKKKKKIKFSIVNFWFKCVYLNV